MPETRRRIKSEFVGYEHECSDCEHAIYRDVLDSEGNPVWEEYEVSDWILMLEGYYRDASSYKTKIQWLEDQFVS